MAQKIKAYTLRARFRNPVPDIDLLATDSEILGIFFNSQDMNQFVLKHSIHKLYNEKNILLDRLIYELFEYFQGRMKKFSLPFILSGTPFQNSVYKTLKNNVNYGETISYKDLATLAGYAGAYRAVGTAMKMNPLPFLIPCHRVVHADGSPGQYAGGTILKEFLINLESSKK